MAEPVVSGLLGDALHALGTPSLRSGTGSLLVPGSQRSGLAAPGVGAPAAPTPEVRRRIARLFARAAFGATVAEIDQWAARGYEATVDHLLDFGPASGRPDDAEVLAVQELSTGGGRGGLSARPQQRWWLQRMATTLYPLEEKLTLYWHGHFATGLVKVGRLPLMLAQNRLFRDNAAGDFRALCKAVTADAAMLLWLDGATNKVGKPNENYGREFLELFSLGHDGGYTQADVREAARAFTGYTVDGDGTVAFKPELHDAGVKTILGQTGAWGPADVVDIVLDHHPRGPVAATYIARRLASFLHRPDPEHEVVAAMAAAFSGGGYRIAPMIKTLLLRPEFTDGPALNVKSPAEVVAGAIRALGVARGDGAAGYVESLLGQPGNDAKNDVFAEASTAMGQNLFDPPNVAGWHGGTAWINTATVLARYNFAARAAQLVGDDQLGSALDGAPAAAPGPWMQRLGLLELLPTTAAAIDAYEARARAAHDDDKTVARGVLTLLLASPDFNLR